MDLETPHFCLFFCQLALEKALKAKFIKTQDEAPLYTHNLKLLAKKAGLKPTQTQLNQLKEITEFNLEARYPEEKQQLYHKATPELTAQWLEITKNLLLWINN